MESVTDYGICKVSVAPLRAEASDTAEIVTQLLFGDHIRVIEKGKPWVKVYHVADDYEGWMDFKQLEFIDQSQFNAYQASEKVYLQEPLTYINGKEGQFPILLASPLPFFENNTVKIGSQLFSFSTSITTAPASFEETVNYYANAPYLWGGKSLFGIDCSGFVQNVFKLHGIDLPRDASAQVKQGKSVSFEEAQPGDVPFFINKKGKVHHVGILMSDSHILHAAGKVRRDLLDEKGIFRKDFNAHTHLLYDIKRFS